MKLKNISINIIITLLFFVPGCKKCNELGELSFTSLEKQIFPYTGNDTILLDLNNGYIDTLTGHGRYDQFIYYNENAGSKTDNKNCDGNYYYSEINGIDFATVITEHSAFTFSVKIEFGNPFENPGINKYLTISVGASYEPRGSFYGSFQFENDSIFVDEIKVFYHDSLTIGGKHFSKVYELYNSAHFFSTYIVIVYYVIQNGIVASQLDYGKIWFFSKKQ